MFLKKQTHQTKKLKSSTDNKIYCLLCIGIFCGMMSCKTRPSGSALALSERQELILLDSTAASQVVVRDEKEDFFGQVGILDMSIQMGRNYPENTNRAEVLEDYRQFLQRDVSSFSDSEKQMLKEVFKQAYERCQKISPDIFPTKLQLLKSKGAPYGPMTFYTRENAIIIPQGLLGAENQEALLEVALHEVFHIFSRYHPEKKKALYALIGFVGISKEYMDLPAPLQKRLLLNPDGIDYAYRIQLKNAAGEKIMAIPLIVSKEDRYLSEKNSFFAYLQFDLYQIQAPYANRIPVLADTEGRSTIDFQKMPDFFRQIRDNTGYIIHPDEIMADNFMFLAMAQKEDKRFSEDGKQLLQQMEEILKKP